MRAIQIRYLSSTATLPSRWKVWAGEHKAITQVANHAPYAVAIKYALHLGWLEDSELVQGELPNGDYVFVLKRRCKGGCHE